MYRFSSYTINIFQLQFREEVKFRTVCNIGFFSQYNIPPICIPLFQICNIRRDGRTIGYGQLSLYEFTSLLLSLQSAYKSCYMINSLSIREAWNFSSNWCCTENNGENLCGIDSLNPELVDSLWSKV